MTKGGGAHIVAMDEEIFKLPVDNALTVRTAWQRGYKWVMDIEQDTPCELLTDMYFLVKQKGYLLGKPRYLWPEKRTEQDRGLYEPLSLHQQKQPLK